MARRDMRVGLLVALRPKWRKYRRYRDSGRLQVRTNGTAMRTMYGIAH